MRATGIVRRMDDLGRVVIPKEIRRVNGLRENDPLEIYVGEPGEIIFKKYVPECLSAQLDDLFARYNGSDLKATEREHRAAQAKFRELIDILTEMERQS